MSFSVIAGGQKRCWQPERSSLSPLAKAGRSRGHKPQCPKGIPPRKKSLPVGLASEHRRWDTRHPYFRYLVRVRKELVLSFPLKAYWVQHSAEYQSWVPEQSLPMSLPLWYLPLCALPVFCRPTPVTLLTLWDSSPLKSHTTCLNQSEDQCLIWQYSVTCLFISQTLHNWSSSWRDSKIWRCGSHSSIICDFGYIQLLSKKSNT